MQSRAIPPANQVDAIVFLNQNTRQCFSTSPSWKSILLSKDRLSELQRQQAERARILTQDDEMPKLGPTFIRAARRKSFVPAKKTVEIVAATSAEPFQGSLNSCQCQRKHIFDKEDSQCKALTQSFLRLPFFLVLRNYKADRHRIF